MRCPRSAMSDAICGSVELSHSAGAVRAAPLE
jgi:hypothetical protein